MATISNTPRPGYVWDSTDNCWYPIGTGPHSHADYITSSSAINPNIVDAKGDIIAATAADTVARLAVGSNDQVLTADSSTATGLKWATPSSEKSILVSQDSTRYMRYFASAALSAALVTEDVTYYMPFYLPGYALDRISMATSSSFSGTATVRLGIYNASSTTGKPSTVYLDAGTVSCTSSGTIYEITISSTPPAGYYYLAFNMQTAATTSSFQRIAASDIINPTNFPTYSDLTNLTQQTGFTESGVTGAFATAGALSTTSSQPVMGVRIA